LFKYDANGNLINHTDCDGNLYTYSYDTHDQLTKETRPDGSVVEHEYNLAGKRIVTRYPKDVTVYHDYDAVTGEKRGEKVVHGGQQDRAYVFEYDKQSRVTKQLEPRGILFEYSYDSFGRVVEVRSSDGPRLEYAYNTAGDVTLIKEYLSNGQDVTIDREYDELGQLISELVTIDSSVHQSASKHWSEGLRAGFAITAQGHTHRVDHAHNAAGRLQQVSCADANYTLKYAYNDAGQMLSWEDELAFREVAEYTVGGMLPKVAATYPKDGDRILYEHFSWGSPESLNGHGMHRSGKPSEHGCYKYDAMGRLTKQRQDVYKHPNWLCREDALIQGTYTYDELGVLQRKSACDHGVCSDYRVREQSGNKVNAECLEATMDGCATENAGVSSRKYDAAGNVIELKKSNGDVLHFSWNVWGELERVSCEGKYEWTAAYDGLGRRILTIYQEEGKDPQSIKSYYDPEVEFLEIGVGRGGELAWKIYGNDSNGVYGGLQG
ncbi:MAG TPA: hypothetical protein PLV25_06280, partial [Opitutales bacterium]|nr:hypothetical protein [Opitutales bacterium]